MIEVKNDSVNQMPLYSYQFTFYDLLDESHFSTQYESDQTSRTDRFS